MLQLYLDMTVDMWKSTARDYVKKENITNQDEEDSDDEDISSRGCESSDDELLGHADP